MLNLRIRIDIITAIALLPVSFERLAHAGIDPVQFLTQESPQIVTEAGKPKQAPGSTGNMYLAQDKFGVQYRLSLEDPSTLYAEIGESLLAQGLGLPNIPSYPTLVERGQKWIPASIQPYSDSLRNIDSHIRLTGNQVGEWLGQIVLKYVLGDRGIIDRSASAGLAGNHVVMTGKVRPFESYGEPHGKSSIQHLTEYLNRLPASPIERLTQSEAQQAFQVLNGYLTRLENMTTEDLNRIFGRHFVERPAVNYPAEWKQRIAIARTSITKYFSSTKVAQIAATTLKEKAPVGRPFFHLPSNSNDALINALQGETSAENRLWHYFFEQNPEVRAQVESAWARRFHSSPATIIKQLLDDAKKKEEVYYISPAITPSPDKKPLKSPQTHLNPDNAKTLVVTSNGGTKLDLIKEMIRESGAKHMEIASESLLANNRLSLKLANKILLTQRLGGAKKILIVDLPGESPEVEELLRKNGKSVRFIDQSNYNGFQKRDSSLSSIEQVARILGYDMGPGEKRLAVLDRSSWKGLSDLGIKKEDAVAHKIANANEALADAVPRFESSSGPIYVVTEQRSRDRKKLKTAIGLREWDRPYNILTIGDTIMFEGTPNLSQQIVKQLSDLGPELGVVYHGGDSTRFEYVAAKASSQKINEGMMRQIAKPLLASLKPQDVPLFQSKISVSEPKVTQAKMDEILALSDEERVNALKYVHWHELSEEAQNRFFEKAKQGVGSTAEINVYLRLANSSLDERWNEVMNQCEAFLKNHPTDDRYRQQLLEAIAHTSSSIKKECLTSEIRSALQKKWQN
jgi:hypothetical protein